MKKQVKALGLIFWLLAFLVLGSLLCFFPKCRDRATQFCASRIAKLLNLKIRREGNLSVSGGVLFVANHLSTLDAIVLLVLFPVKFVTSEEVASDWIQGSLAKVANCVFFERRSYLGLSSEIEAVEKALRAGEWIACFPEATTGSGESVLRFRTAIFEAAIRAEATVVPLTINYHTVDGSPVSQNNRNSIFYFGEMKFLEHLDRLLSCDEISVESVAHRPLASRLFDRKELALKAQSLVASRFISVGGKWCAGSSYSS